MKYIASTSSNSPSLLRKTAAVVVTVAVAGAALMFSAVLLAALLVLGLIAAAWVWWKTRELRKVMRQFQARAANDPQAFQDNAHFEQVFRGGVSREEPVKGEIIEGEAVRVHESREGAGRR